MRWIWLVTMVGALGAATGISIAQDDALQQEMERWRQEQKRHLARLFEIEFEKEGSPRISDELLTQHATDTLELLVPYQQDSSSSTRSLAYAYVRRTGLLSRDSKIREEAVSRLVNACFDPDGLVWQHAAKWLLDFQEADFTWEAGATLGNGVMQEPVRDDVILVVGVAKLDVLDKWLKKISDEHFNAVLALARLGDDEAARQAVERAKNVDKDEDKKNKSLWTKRYLKKLAYTRHPIAFAYIAQFLDSDEGKRTLKETGDYYAPPYKQVAIGALAEHFPDCPVKPRKSGHYSYSDADFAEVSEWVKKRLEDAER